ncbi:hypothetical protein V6N13_025264 [Hibiscus sabdariffa]|uniref:Uncharacterized protein n=2 Tax=Hibiscus sabdariffa TaxID=183260 RepID=A0ABR2NHP6_9ROSI
MMHGLINVLKCTTGCVCRATSLQRIIGYKVIVDRASQGVLVRSTDAQIDKKACTLPSQVPRLKGLVQDIVAAFGATPGHFATTFVALITPWFQCCCTIGCYLTAPPPSEAGPVAPPPAQGRTVSRRKRKTTAGRILNFSSNAQASSPPTKKAKDKGKAP